MATVEGTANVYRKLKTAARKVCGVDDGSRLTLDQGTKAQECFETPLPTQCGASTARC